VRPPRRTPVVKRPTPPRSGFAQFFPLRVQAARRAPLALCSVFIAVGWCPNVAAPHTSGGSLARQRASAEGPGVTLGGLETSPYPHTGLFHKGAERRTFASEAQTRVRGSHIIERDRSPSGESRSKRPIKRRELRDTGPTGSYAFNDAGSTLCRASYPGSSRQGQVRP